MVQEFEQFARRFESTSPYAARLIRRTGQELFEKGDIEQTLEEEESPFVTTDGEKVYSHHQFTYYPERSSIVINSGKPVPLNRQTNKLLYQLALTPNRLVTNHQLREELMDYTPIKDRISTLRKLFRENGLDPNIIVNIVGQGYSLIDPSYQPKELAIGAEKPELVYHLSNDVDYFPQRSCVKRGGEIIQLSRQENLFLEFLAREPNRIVPHVEIGLKLWGIDEGPMDEDQAIKSIGTKVRGKVEPQESRSSHSPQLIIRVAKQGYKLRVPNKPNPPQ